jgi:flagellar hook-length control protein FliK
VSTSSKSQAAVPATSTGTNVQSIATATASASDLAPTNAPKRRSTANPGLPVANNLNVEGGEPLNDGAPSAPMAAGQNTHQKNLVRTLEY